VKPWETLGRARTPDGNELTLVRHPSEWAILIDGERLMTSRMHGSEDALATLGCARARELPAPRVLIGGLGMGYTLRAALDTLPARAEVVVAELVPEVVQWNREHLGPLAGFPLDDPRTAVEVADVVEVIRRNPGGFDALMLDVDNGADALVQEGNASLYDAAGIAMSRASLRRGGVIAYWSVSDDPRFERRLKGAGFRVQREHVRSRPTKRGFKHTVLLALA
jgi:spermidine synthase